MTSAILGPSMSNGLRLRAVIVTLALLLSSHGLRLMLKLRSISSLAWTSIQTSATYLLIAFTRLAPWTTVAGGP